MAVVPGWLVGWLVGLRSQDGWFEEPRGMGWGIEHGG